MNFFGSRFAEGAESVTQQVHALSTRNPRLPAGCKASDIFRRVHIAVMLRFAIGTRPVPHRQRHFRRVRTAGRTGLAARKPAVYHDHWPPVPRGFVLDLPSELAHADILNRAGQVVILDHASHVQVFQRDDIGALDDGRGGLVAAGGGAAARSVRPADLLTRE